MSQVAGIDYSMTSPAICCYDGSTWRFFFLTSKKKLEGTFHTEDNTMSFTGTNIDHLSTNDLDRFDMISDWAIDVLKQNDVTTVMLEDYSFGSTGRTFQIGENTGLLKYKIKSSKITYETVPPTVLKKFATGKGNAKKELLNETFKQTVGIDVKVLLEQSDKSWNPSSDIIDAYYLTMYAIKEKQDGIEV